MRKPCFMALVPLNMFVGAIIGGDTLQSKSKATRPAFVTSSTEA
jgi:hypothetical protein